MAAATATAEERVYVALAGLVALSSNAADAPDLHRIVPMLTIEQIRESIKKLKKKRLVVSVPGGYEPAPQDCTLSVTAIPGNRIKVETDSGLLEMSHAQAGMLCRLLPGFASPLGVEV